MSKVIGSMLMLLLFVVFVGAAVMAPTAGDDGIAARRAAAVREAQGR
jgi:hypothetical protein